MNPATLIVSAALAVVIILLVRYEWKKRKSGGCSCGGNCCTCGGCHGEQKN